MNVKPPPPLINVFIEICDAEAYVWRLDDSALDECLSSCRRFARSTGLTQQLGRDAVEAIIMRAFLWCQFINETAP
ncbi:MAG TPA: hypothetical protein VHT52_20785 [Stellaceae bacterium]|nr:hypothetical protein [Stellaceae bacterium]